MEKITLTKNDIKKEALQKILYLIPELFILMLVLGLPTALLINIFEFTSGLETLLCSFLVIPLVIIMVGVFLYYLHSIIEYIFIYNGKFSIITAALGNKQEQKGRRGRRRIWEERYEPAKLFFPDKMIYVINSDYGFYKWTKVMPMTGRRIFESADIGEEFYLVTIGQKRKKIIFIYNFQFFELKE